MPIAKNVLSIAIALIYLHQDFAHADFTDEGIWSPFPVLESVDRQHNQKEVVVEAEKQQKIDLCLRELEQEQAQYKEHCATAFGAYETSGSVVNSLLQTTISCELRCITPAIEVNGCKIKKYIMESSKKEFFLAEQKNGVGVFNKPLYLVKGASEMGAIMTMIEMIKTRPEGKEKCGISKPIKSRRREIY